MDIVTIVGAIVSVFAAAYAAWQFVVNRRDRIRERLFDLRLEFAREHAPLIQKVMLACSRYTSCASDEERKDIGKEVIDLRNELLTIRPIASLILDSDSFKALEEFSQFVFGFANASRAGAVPDYRSDRFLDICESYDTFIQAMRKALKVDALDREAVKALHHRGVKEQAT